MTAPRTDPDRDGLFGDRLGRHLDMSSRPLFRASRNDRLSIAVTRITGRGGVREMTAPIAPEAAFSVSYKLRNVERHEFWSDGRRRYDRGFTAGTVNAVDLSEDPQSRLTGPFDAVQFYIRKDVLNEIAEERGASSVLRLRTPEDAPDAVAGAFCSMLLSPASAELAQTNRLFADQLSLSFLTYFAETFGGMRALPTTANGRLAPWQERRAKDIMHARMGARVSIADIAAECRLSPSYFARAFRRTTGINPHKYLSDLRLRETKILLRSSTLPLADIGVICGFGDQAYFTRVFAREAGIGPGAWRRAVRD